MPFWNRRPDENEVQRSYIEQTANEAARELTGGADPRDCIPVEMMLTWLWKLDGARMRALHRVFGPPGTDAEQYVRFLELLAAGLDGVSATPPYPVVAARLREMLAGFLTTEQTPLGERETYSGPRILLESGVAMVGWLEAVEAHGPVCRLLSAAHFRLQKRAWNAGRGVEAGPNPEAEARNLIKLCTECLLSLPPDEIPEFWSWMQALSTARDLRPVAARMRDRRAVPYLLATLPCLDEDGQSDVIMALGNIKDTRAVPALQELAADKSHLIATVAAHALSEILRTSRDDAAQLLRATDYRHAGAAAETLLRASAPTLPTTPADQLLRAATDARESAPASKKDR